MSSAKSIIPILLFVGIFIPAQMGSIRVSALITVTSVRTATSTFTATPSRTPSATPTSVQTQTPFVVTVIHTKVVTQLASSSTPGSTPTNTAIPAAGSVDERETGNQSPLSNAIIGMLAIFIGGLVIGILWSNWRKR